MITVYNNPLLLDFIRVALEMPQDEKDQLEQLTGHKWDIDGAAVGGFSVVGPKWVIKDDDRPIVIGGFSLERPGVYRDFLCTTPDAFTTHWFKVTRICRRIMDAMLISGQAHRLECITPAPRLALRPEIEKWYKILGYNKEAVLHGYCANGADAISYCRVKH